MHGGAEDTKRRIIDAAFEMFGARGLDNVSIQDLSKASGVSNGSMFYHFGSKNAIALEAYLIERRNYWTAAIEALEQFDGPPAQAVGAAAEALLLYQEEHPERHRFMLECSSAEWMQQHTRAVEALNEEFIKRFFAWGGPHYAAGELKPMRPEVIAALVFGPVQWLSRAASIGFTTVPLSTIAPEFGEAVALFFEGDKTRSV